MAEPSRRQGTSSPASHVAAVSHNDARIDLGYGTTKTKFQSPRSLNGSFPYREPDEYEDVLDIEMSDDSLEAVSKKSLDYSATDSLAGNSSDPFYFVGGNTKLSDCFWRQEKVLQEIAVFSDSMSSVPQAYKGKGPSLSGNSAAFSAPGSGGSSFKRTGTLQGWSKSPPPLNYEDEVSKDEFEDEGDTYTLEDLAKKKSIEDGFPNLVDS
tara:strand:- start:1501 stop:2130 length:630 start_codon:yes stop_codon:yes gene_type:complete